MPLTINIKNEKWIEFLDSLIQDLNSNSMNLQDAKDAWRYGMKEWWKTKPGHSAQMRKLRGRNAKSDG